MRHMFKARKQYEIDALKFTAPSVISFISNLARMEIDFLIEPVELHHELKIRKLVAGEKCSFLVYLVVTNEDDLVCQLVPTHDEGQAIEVLLKKGKYKFLLLHIELVPTT